MSQNNGLSITLVVSFDLISAEQMIPHLEKPISLNLLTEDEAMNILLDQFVKIEIVK